MMSFNIKGASQQSNTVNPYAVSTATRLLSFVIALTIPFMALFLFHLLSGEHNA